MLLRRKKQMEAVHQHHSKADDDDDADANKVWTNPLTQVYLVAGLIHLGKS